MSSHEQIKANKKNALLSTGPITLEGKLQSSKNALQHGIFSKELIISGEERQDYGELHSALTESFSPNNKAQEILVEKIVVDFWRLKRVLRFEKGSIKEYFNQMIKAHCDHQAFNGNKGIKRLDEVKSEIKEYKEGISWNQKYIKALEGGKVRLDKPLWKNRDIESNIEEELFYMARSHEILAQEILHKYEFEGISFEEFKKAFKDAGYDDQDLIKELIKYYQKENEEFQDHLLTLKQEENKSKQVYELTLEVSSLPAEKSSEKVIRYESFLQKSILQNIALLKQLQSMK